MRSFLAIVSFLALAGCSHPHGPFQFSDIEALSVGESTRDQVERRLGEPKLWSARSAIHIAGKSTTIPDAPFSFITWPIYRGWLGQRVTVTVWYDERKVVSEGSITLDASSLDEYLLIFNARRVEYTLEDELLEPLRRIESKGFKLQVAEGNRIFSFKSFLERNSPR